MPRILGKSHSHTSVHTSVNLIRSTELDCRGRSKRRGKLGEMRASIRERRWVYVCVFKCVSVLLFVFCLCVCWYACVYAYMCIYVSHMYMYMCTYTYVYKIVHKQAYILMYTYTCIYVFVCVDVYTNATYFLVQRQGGRVTIKDGFGRKIWRHDRRDSHFPYFG